MDDYTPLVKIPAVALPVLDQWIDAHRPRMTPESLERLAALMHTPLCELSEPEHAELLLLTRIQQRTGVQA